MAVKGLEGRGRDLSLIMPGWFLPGLGVCLCTNWVYGQSLIFVFSSPFDLLVEWRGVRKKLPRVVAPEGASGDAFCKQHHFVPDDGVNGLLRGAR